MIKTILTCIAAAVLLSTSSPPAAAALSVSVDLFYDSLEPHGEWIEVEDYGYCWYPRDVGEAWRPYTVGHWVFTDAGWTWVSDEPYGWAVYHYGRWVQLDSVGWVWVPDEEWGPAWVSWRRSDRHVGWAPLPPEAQFTRTRVIREWADSYYDIGPAYYSFVEVRNFGAPRLREVIVEPQQNITIINQTTNITNIRVENDVVYNGGPEYDVIVKESAQPVRRLKLERRTEIAADRAGRRAEQFVSRVEGDSLRVIAPQIQPAAEVKPRKVARRIEQAKVNRGWQNAGDQSEVQRVRAKIRAEAKPPADLPAQPKFEKMTAKATEKARRGAAAKPQPDAEASPALPPSEDAATTAAPPVDQPVTRTDKPAKRGADTNARRRRGEPDPSATESPAAITRESRPGTAKRNNAAPRNRAERDAKREAAAEAEAGVPVPDPAAVPPPSAAAANDAATPPEADSAAPATPPAAVSESSPTQPGAGSDAARPNRESKAERSIPRTNRRGRQQDSDASADAPATNRDAARRSGANARQPEARRTSEAIVEEPVDTDRELRKRGEERTGRQRFNETPARAVDRAETRERAPRAEPRRDAAVPPPADPARPRRGEGEKRRKSVEEKEAASAAPEQ